MIRGLDCVYQMEKLKPPLLYFWRKKNRGFFYLFIFSIWKIENEEQKTKERKIVEKKI